jgi:probable HAF family extracellular repeat protein
MMKGCSIVKWGWAGCLAVCVAVAGAARAASFEGLGMLDGGADSEAVAVSADGSVVVGTSGTASGQQAFRWTADGGMVPVPIPAGLTSTWGTDVSADGSIVLGQGRQSASPPFGYEGFRWSIISGALDPIAEPGSNVYANAISADGSTVVGAWGVPGGDEHAYQWTAAGGLAPLEGLGAEPLRTTAQAVSADGLVVVGHRIYTASPWRDGFRWTQAAVAGISNFEASDVSDDGSVVVGTMDNHETQLFEAYRWTEQDGVVPLGTCLPNFQSRALAVSADGSIIVGYVQNNSGYDEQKAFIWDQQHGMRLLNEVLEGEFALDLSDWHLTEPWSSWKATDISADGTTIVGVAVNADNQREAWRAVISELPVPGDADGDGNVGAYDYVALKRNIGMDYGASREQGDFDGDRDVDRDDLLILIAGLTRASSRGPSPNGAGQVPEPTAISLLALGGLALVRRKRRPLSRQ